MGAPIGNKNGAKSQRLWRDALLRQAAQNPQALNNIARKVFDMAMEGDMMAVREIGDRIDGKPMQQVQVEDVSLQKAYLQASDDELMAVVMSAKANKQGKTLQ